MNEDILDPSFKETQMIIQLRKVVDSIGNPRPLSSVKTDDGDEVPVTTEQAKYLCDLFDRLDTTGQNRRSIFTPEIRAKKNELKRILVSKMQRTSGLTHILENMALDL